jgi:hypothetical protein
MVPSVDGELEKNTVWDALVSLELIISSTLPRSSTDENWSSLKTDDSTWISVSTSTPLENARDARLRFRATTRPWKALKINEAPALMTVSLMESVLWYSEFRVMVGAALKDEVTRLIAERVTLPPTPKEKLEAMFESRNSTMLSTRNPVPATPTVIGATKLLSLKTRS